MAISDSYLKANINKEREKIEEKADRDGLWIRISVKGSITFFYRYRFLGKPDKMTLGSYPALSLKAAREEVEKWAGVLAGGDNPKIKRNLERGKISNQFTFEELFREWHSMVCIQKGSATQVLRSFEIHVFPKIGKYPAADLTLHNWLTILDKLAKGYSEITKRVISNGKQCYSWAVKRQLLAVNPLAELTGRDFGIQKGMGKRVLSRDEIAIFWKGCDDSRMSQRNKIMLKLCLFYGCRISELRLAKKSDFDFEEGVWTIPPENHKTGAKTQRSIQRPIIKEILPLLKEAKSLSDGDYIFSSKKDGPMSAGNHLSLTANLRLFMIKAYDVNIPHFSVHDLRRTARTNFSDLTAPHIAEIMLGHMLPGVWAVYDKHTYLKEMKDAYSKWWARLMSIVEPDVIEFKPRSVG
ncbi:site-specific integrase [Hafnia alvei]|uniref:tyrosine-type recombinase/integrase n=1 Tax=Hafnia alvei TaxID=569 RepID=UPI002DB71EC6|nr:site-specific integrase [Hafnia alvei]MEB7891027.1 site-specific integrase [Hafnia alvei]